MQTSTATGCRASERERRILFRDAGLPLHARLFDTVTIRAKRDLSPTRLCRAMLGVESLVQCDKFNGFRLLV